MPLPGTAADRINSTLDANGRFVRGPLTTVFASRKEKGFGTEYGPIRGGEWKYVSYNPDWSFASAPANTRSCVLCHLTGTGGGSGAMPDGVMLNYLYLPRTIHV